MKSAAWRPPAILVLGLLAVFGVPVARTLTLDAVPAIWIQVPAAVGALVLLAQELRSRNAAGRWRLLALLGGGLALAWAVGVAILLLVWPR